MKPPNHGMRVRVHDGRYTFDGCLALDLPREGKWSGLVLLNDNPVRRIWERHFIDSTMRLEVLR